MIPTITKELESFKAKVQQTIDHVSSGVNNLNEDQQEQAIEMLHGLGEELFTMKDRCFEALGVETLTQRLAKAQANEAAKSPAVPSAADLDAVAAAEEKVKEATGSVAWSGNKLEDKIHDAVESAGNALGEAFENRGQ
jgi:hypothetical protein